MKRWFSLILKLSITFGILSYILLSVPFSDVIASITSANAFYLLAALLIIPSTIFLEACRMKVLTDWQGMNLSTLQIVEINLATRFYGLFLPGHLTGGVIRLWKFSQSGNRWTEALASIAVNRLMGTVVLVMVGIVFWTIDPGANSNYTLGLLLSAVLAGLLILHFLIFHNKAYRFLGRYLGGRNLFGDSGLISGVGGKLIIAVNRFRSFPKHVVVYIYFLCIIGN